MKLIFAILAGVALAILGGNFGSHLGSTGAEDSNRPSPEPAAVEQVKITHSFAEAHQLKEDTWEDAERYALTLEIEAMPLSELSEHFEELAREDPDKGNLNDLPLRQALDAVIARDPHEAIRLIQENFHGLKRFHAYATLLDRWGRSDPHAALKWLSGFSEDDPSSSLLNATTGFLHEWASRDARGALDAWLALPEPKLHDAAAAKHGAESLARNAGHTPELHQAALEVLIAAPPSDARTSAIGGALAMWVHRDTLPEVTGWLEQQELSDKEVSKIAVLVAQAAAVGGDAGAGDWLGATISGDNYERSNYLDEFAEYWAAEEPNACARWLATLDPSDENDWAIRGFLRRAGYSDPESGFHWTRKITDQELRKKTARELWNEWRRRAPVSAQKFLPELDADEREWLNQAR